jgi:hypothetical protein
MTDEHEHAEDDEEEYSDHPFEAPANQPLIDFWIEVASRDWD